ncbi:hypothetical protein ONZ45_g5426 [Pleurotus djamor]|nr:hypothetical protein ONZ45_g5426 [Pleurotus djamor]
MSLGVALITGASRGIGRAVALRLAKDGYDIALNDLRANSKHIDSVKEEISRIGRRACVVPADVKHEKEVVGMVDETVKALGSLNVMVANAGIVQYGSILDTSTELWDEVLAINGRGVFLCYKYAAKQMIFQGSGGRIIGASSVSGKQGGALQGAYCASKFAVRGLTQSVARELAPHGITVNAYSPGPISTAMMGRVHELSGTPDEKYQLEVEATPLKRYGKPEEVAALVSFLASDGAAYITGQSVSINGGRFCD